MRGSSSHFDIVTIANGYWRYIYKTYTHDAYTHETYTLQNVYSRNVYLGILYIWIDLESFPHKADHI
jgi:hypothetical protein